MANRRIGAALRQQGMVVNSKKLRRLMREHDLQPRIKRRFVATTDSDHDSPIFPNLAKDLVPSGPNQLWVSDITRGTSQRLTMARVDRSDAVFSPDASTIAFSR